MKRFLMIALGMTSVFCGMMAEANTSQAPQIKCPVLTASDVKSVIEQGFIGTTQGHTLAVEADETPADVLRMEPTANPFDTFYVMNDYKTIGNTEYVIVIGNVLGKDVHEAKHRAKKILLGSEQAFQGQTQVGSQMCLYKDINATASIPGYPFKSTYETVVLIAVQDNDDMLSISKTLQRFTKNRHR